MGVTVTTNLGLIKPDGSEKIQEDLPTYPGWHDQNADNMDTIDSIFRNNNSTYAMAWGATTTPPTLGAGGFVEGKFVRLYPKMVVVHFRIFCGGVGFLAGTGTYTLTLPVAVEPELASMISVPVGKMIVQDNSSALASDLFGLYADPATSLVTARPANGLTWTNVTPFTPAQNDRFSGYMLYPTAVA